MSALRVWHTAAPRRFRLRDGSDGNEQQAIVDAIRSLEARRQGIDDRIDALRRRLAMADDRPLIR